MPYDELADEPDYSALRKSQDKELTDEGLRFLVRLPESVRPSQAAHRFPHVINRLARLWTHPRAVERYFDDLLIDQRGGRQGFPLAILSEFFALKEHYMTKVNPAPKTAWDDLYVSDGRNKS
ncbi:MAG: hypothetical protein HY778_07015 [Betaproteobacteria bacterium]|nr:hypothetical protein [Betaproteobacteria bacterium]